MSHTYPVKSKSIHFSDYQAEFDVRLRDTRCAMQDITDMDGNKITKNKTSMWLESEGHGYYTMTQQTHMHAQMAIIPIVLNQIGE